MRFWLHLKLCYILSVMAVFLTMKTNSWSGIADSNWTCHPQIQTHRLVLSICTYHQTVAFINLLIAVLTLTLDSCPIDLLSHASTRQTYNIWYRALHTLSSWSLLHVCLGRCMHMCLRQANVVDKLFWS